jgi:hypothetical protein
MDNASIPARNRCSQASEEILLLRFVSGFKYVSFICYSQINWSKHCYHCATKPVHTLVDSNMPRLSYFIFWRNFIYKTPQGYHAFLNWWQTNQTGVVFLAHEVVIILTHIIHNPHEQFLVPPKAPTKVLGRMCFVCKTVSLSIKAPW